MQTVQRPSRGVSCALSGFLASANLWVNTLSWFLLSRTVFYVFSFPAKGLGYVMQFESWVLRLKLGPYFSKGWTEVEYRTVCFRWINGAYWISMRRRRNSPALGALGYTPQNINPLFGIKFNFPWVAPFSVQNGTWFEFHAWSHLRFTFMWLALVVPNLV